MSTKSLRFIRNLSILIFTMLATASYASGELFGLLSELFQQLQTISQAKI